MRLCFIDDDEYPDRRWLVELVACWRTTGAELIGGPVRVAAPPALATSWQRLVNASLAARARRKERDAAADAARGRCRTIVTNNFLCDLRFAERHGLRFDETLLVTGGSDTDFFRRAVRGGLPHRLVPRRRSCTRSSRPTGCRFATSFGGAPSSRSTTST